ncbi:MAG: peptidylprolyl isomerase [Cyanobacteria bacterium]|nr:peptidylprolyl isomerase [Cyanobacteriota bacterium]
MTEIDKSARDTEENAPILKEYQGFLIQTEKGNIGIEVFPEQAPATVKNFLKLVEEKFYDKPSMVFHRVVPGFVIQTGDPTGTGMGGSGKRIPLEVKNKLSHNAKGMVAMARTSDPNSATSQFYITLAPQTSLDGKYAVFGKVISGSDVLDKIKQGDKLYGIKLIDKRALVPDKKEDKKGLGHFKNLFGTPSKS